jgi:MFS family permease
LTAFRKHDRNVVSVSIATLTLTFGEELWKRFIPKYLERLGAPLPAIGFYGTLRDFLDGAYQYPGGWVADRYGRRSALLAFIGVALTGYVVYAAIPAWPTAFIGLVLVMAWASMASPVLFAVIGDALPKGKRTGGFTLQSIVRRIPIVFAPAIGGAIIARLGIVEGVRVGLMVSAALAAGTLLIVRRIDVTHVPMPAGQNVAGVWREMVSHLRRLLLSDILVRVCEGMVDVLIVLYALNVIGISPSRFGILVGIQTLTAIAAYIPGARFADQLGRKPVVAATFLMFAAFPVAVITAHGFAGLVFAFIIGGLREIGEPARKALIVDLAVPHARARTVGLYYLIRSLSITPAAVIGALLWERNTAAPFLVAAVFGLAGLIVFVATVRE